MKAPFQATVVRYLHDVLSGEFINIGVVLFSKEAVYTGARFLSQWSRVSAAFPTADLPHLRRIASAIEEACPPNEPTLFLPDVDLAAFQNRVLSRDDAGIQFSPIISGVTDSPARTLSELHARYVEQHLQAETSSVARTDTQVWQDFVRRMVSHVDVLNRLRPLKLRSPRTPTYQYDFEKAWKNAQWHIAQPVSLDMVNAGAIREKAIQWTGRIIALHPSEQNANVVFLVGMPRGSVPEPIRQAATDAIQILEENLEGEARVLTEDRGAELVEKIANDLVHSDTPGT